MENWTQFKYPSIESSLNISGPYKPRILDNSKGVYMQEYALSLLNEKNKENSVLSMLLIEQQQERKYVLDSPKGYSRNWQESMCLGMELCCQG